MGVKNLGQLLSPEVESNCFSVAGVMDLDVNLIIIFILSNESCFQTGHLILLTVHQDLNTK